MQQTILTADSVDETRIPPMTPDPPPADRCEPDFVFEWEEPSVAVGSTAYMRRANTHTDTQPHIYAGTRAQTHTAHTHLVPWRRRQSLTRLPACVEHHTTVTTTALHACMRIPHTRVGTGSIIATQCKITHKPE